jgi:hypothetical protein
MQDRHPQPGDIWQHWEGRSTEFSRLRAIGCSTSPPMLPQFRGLPQAKLLTGF